MLKFQTRLECDLRVLLVRMRCVSCGQYCGCLKFYLSFRIRYVLMWLKKTDPSVVSCFVRSVMLIVCLCCYRECPVVFHDAR